MIDVIAKHDIEYKDDKGVAQSAKAKQIVKMPKDEFDKLFAIKAVVRADKDVVRADKDVVEEAPAKLATGLTDAAPAGSATPVEGGPVAETSAKKK